MKKVVKSVKVKAKRVDWKAACQKARRDLYKAQMEFKDSEKVGMEMFRENKELKQRVAELHSRNLSWEAEHKQAVDAGLRACEEARARADKLEKQKKDAELHDRYRQQLEKTIDEREEMLKEKDRKIEELRGQKVELHVEKNEMVKAARGLHAAVGALLNV